MKTKSLVITALFVALLCIASPFCIYIGAVPITLCSFAVCLCAALLGARRGVFAVLTYIALGAVGLPVFAGFQGGAQVLFSQTGGFIIGYIFCAVIVGLGCEKFSFFGHTPLFIALGVIACMLCGSFWYALVLKVDYAVAFGVCCVAFLPAEAIKVAACSILVKTVKRFLR